MLMISVTLLWMRVHVRDSSDIESDPIDKRSDARGMIRIVMPGVMAIVAIALSFVNVLLSLSLFVIAIYFNLATSNAHWLDRFFDWVNSKFINKPRKKNVLKPKSSKKK